MENAFYRSGRYADALKQFRESYAADSTFPLVPLRIYTVNGWLLSGQYDGPWVQRAQLYRSRLTGADSLLLEAYYDPAFPNGTPPLENMERVWNIAQRANSAELWYVAADNYMHNATSVGYNDAMARALKGFKLAEAVDSSYVGGLEHQSLLYLIFGDTVAARAADRRQARVDSTGDFYVVGNGQLRISLATPSELPAIAHAVVQGPANVAVQIAIMTQSIGTIFSLPLGMTVVDSVLASKQVRAGLVPGSTEMVGLQDLYHNSGRIVEAQQHFARDTTAMGSARSILSALYWDADTASAALAAGRIDRWQQARS